MTTKVEKPQRHAGRVDRVVMPCPFCGERDSIWFSVDEVDENAPVFVACGKCDCQGPSNDDGDLGERISAAIDLWNARAA